MPTPTTGHNMKLYRNTGTPATPTWVELAEVGDVNLADFTRGLAELKRRANQFTKNIATLIQTIAIEFRLHYGLDATNFDAIRTNFLAGTVEEWAIFNGDIATVGNEGLRCPVIVENFPWDQPLEDVAGNDVRLAIGYLEDSGTEVDPSWYVITV